MVTALERWPQDGVPRNPGAWLMATAKNRQIDLARRTAMFRVKRDELARETELTTPAPSAAPAVEDDLLRLIFTTCHPALTRDSQVALTLRMLGGLKTDEIARALLTSEATVGTRISRAKRTLADAGSPFEVPGADELEQRIAAVLSVVYLIFNEGYSATAGADWMRLDLCEDALRLGRVLQAQLPDEPEVHGLAGLMEIQSSRARARTGPGGEVVLLPDQDRSKWDRQLIERGLAAIERAHAAPGRPGVYTLQAELSACHAVAPSHEETDWPRIAALYMALGRLTGSPVVEVNRAVAVGMADGPVAGLEVLRAVEDAPELADYHLLAAVRGDLLAKDGRNAEAAADFERAASMTRNERERDALTRRVGELRKAP